MPAGPRAGSLLSDRITVRPSPSPLRPQQQNKGKGRSPTPEPPKSRAVRSLEALLDGARGANARTKDPKGGCFCLAREHPLSRYAPICRHCGLILCALNPPHYVCPHCTEPLVHPQEQEMLVSRLEAELSEQLAKEEAERQRAIEEARAAEGAFPMLPGSPAAQTVGMGPVGRIPPQTTTRTVLSLNSTTKMVTVSSYSTTTPQHSRPVSREKDREEEGPRRVVGPSKVVSHVREPLETERPWKNIIGSMDVRYVPLPGELTGRTAKGGGRKKGDGHGYPITE